MGVVDQFGGIEANSCPMFAWRSYSLPRRVVWKTLKNSHKNYVLYVHRQSMMLSKDRLV